MRQYKPDNSPIAYYISGREHEEWCLFIHAAFVSHEMFKTQIDYFKSKYNVLTVDIIGHGQSSDAKRGDSINKMSEWIYKIMRAERIDKLHIVGVSLGAVIAQDFANRYPGSVSSLACFGGYDINNFNDEMQKDNSSSQMLMMLKAFVSIKWFAKANKKISAFTSQAQEEFYDMNIKFKKKSFKYLTTLNSMANKFKTAKRNYPLLIGCGEFDIPMELEAVEMWKSSEPQAEVVVFKNAGHCANMDSPDEFNRALEDFWVKNR